MLVRAIALAGAATVAAMAGAAMGQAVQVHTDDSGTYLVPMHRAPLSNGGFWGNHDTVLWTYNHPTSISESISLGPVSGSAFVGQYLNFQRLQRFEINGNGTPTFERIGGASSPSFVSAAKNADRVAWVDFPDVPTPGTRFKVHVFNGAGIELWTREFPESFNHMNRHMLKFSRDGSTLAVGLNDSGENSTSLYFLNGADGEVVQAWASSTGSLNSVDLTDDGSMAFVQHTSTGVGAVGRLILRSTGQEVFSASGSGGGSRYQISGDGNVLVLGGFSFHVYRRTNTGTYLYPQIINFTTPTSWFGWGSAVSRDGSTVAVMSHDYGSGYLNTNTRIWDVASGAMLGQFPTSGSGSLQGSIAGAALSDNGQVLAVASWGTQDQSHPEVMVFDRGVKLIGGIDFPGSAFDVDVTGDGRYVLAGSKAVHANTMGNGGNTAVFDTGIGGVCYANCDGSTVEPVLNVADFSCFLAKFATGDPYANCDASTTPPVLNVADFSCFLAQFAAGCR
jgi:hypothetical protein